MLNLVRHSNNSRKIIQDGYSLLLVSHASELKNEEFSLLDGFIIDTDSEIYAKEIITKIRTHDHLKVSLLPLFVNSIYSISASVGEVLGQDYNLLNRFDSYPYEDNSTCLEGNVTYTSKPYIPLSSVSSDAAQSEDENDLGISCGTIDIDDNSNSSGGASFLIGLIFMILLINIDVFKHKVLSKY